MIMQQDGTNSKYLIEGLFCARNFSKHIIFIILFNFYQLLVESTVIIHILQMRTLRSSEVIACLPSKQKSQDLNLGYLDLEPILINVLSSAKINQLTNCIMCILVQFSVNFMLTEFVEIVFWIRSLIKSCFSNICKSIT